MDPNNSTILLVDDEEDILEFLQYNLSKEGYHVVTANNGKLGLDIATIKFLKVTFQKIIVFH